MAAYLHNRLIAQLFREARQIAWAQIRNHPEAVKLYAEDRRLNVQNNKSLSKTGNYVNPYDPYGLVLPNR